MSRSALMLSLIFQAFSVVPAAGIIPEMKKIHGTTLPPEESLADLAHFAWCALVGLRLAQQDGQALSPLTIHTFLVRWLADAKRQRRFPRSVAADIDSLLLQGRQKGQASNLQQRLESLWQSCSEPVAQQPDLLRLTYAIEHLKSRGWVNAVVADEEWLPGSLYTEYANTAALLVRESGLQRHFNGKGRLTAPVDFIVTGDWCAVADVLDTWELRYATGERHAGWCSLALVPSEEKKEPEERMTLR